MLPPDHAAALEGAIHSLIDDLCDDVATLLQEPDAIEETTLGTYLPRCYFPRYTPVFAKQFLMTTGVVAWKLAQPQWHPLACIAEELALNAIIRIAKTVLRDEGRQPNFSFFFDSAFEDLDFEMLLDPAWDGYADDTSLAIEEWFSPFGEDTTYPYLVSESKNS